MSFHVFFFGEIKNVWYTIALISLIFGDDIEFKHLVEAYNPAWAPLLSRGRREAVQYLPRDIQQCLREADLLNLITDEVVFWWDEIAQAARKSRQDRNLEIGRYGEKLSIEYEKRRTTKEPIWQAIESNLSGFDILSVVDENDDRALRVEVKTSDSIPIVASFHVTRNEWNVATTSDNYLFHLWVLRPKPELIELSVDEISRHISEDRGMGQWESILINCGSSS